LRTRTQQIDGETHKHILRGIHDFQNGRSARTGRPQGIRDEGTELIPAAAPRGTGGSAVSSAGDKDYSGSDEGSNGNRGSFQTWNSPKSMKDGDLDAKDGIIAERPARNFRLWVDLRIEVRKIPPNCCSHDAKLELILYSQE
jgi:hypothetical protein